MKLGFKQWRRRRGQSRRAEPGWSHVEGR